MSLVSEDTYQSNTCESQQPDSTGEHLEVLGTMDVEVTYGEQQVTLPLLFVNA